MPRGQAGALATPPSDFGPWGGSIAFDDSNATSWYFGLDTSGLTSNETDFFTVAEHEIGHVLGIGTSPSWMSDIVNDTFVGAHAEAGNGGQPVPLDAAGQHWAQGMTSDGQPAVMTPVLLDGTRRDFTPLDFAGLADIGWQVQAAAPALQFSQQAYSVSESGGSVMIPVTRTGDSSGAVSVQVSTSDGSAKAGVDYTGVTQTLNWGDGDTSTQDVVISIIDNVHATGALTLNLNLGDLTGGAVLGEPSTATLTITLGNAVVQLASAQYTANISAGAAQIVVTRSADLGGTVTAPFCRAQEGTTSRRSRRR